MGLRPSKPPDDDELFQSALGLNLVHSVARGINRSTKEVSRTASEIRETQHRFQKVFSRFMKYFRVKESTKLHRLISHVSEQLHLFGSFRISDTGPNESLHKGVKASY